MDASLTCSLSQKADAGRQMMLHTSYLVSRPIKYWAESYT